MPPLAELQDAASPRAMAPSPRNGRRRGRDQPALHSVHDGDTVWFPYTANQWMRGRVMSFSRRGLCVEVMGGKVSRTMHVKWGDALWHQPRDAR
jgi:hypothetical protein